MEIRSGAGTFEFTPRSIEVHDGSLVIHGTVDEWDARTVVGADELRGLLALTLKSGAPRLLVAEQWRRWTATARGRRESDA